MQNNEGQWVDESSAYNGQTKNFKVTFTIPNALATDTIVLSDTMTGMGYVDGSFNAKVDDTDVTSMFSKPAKQTEGSGFTVTGSHELMDVFYFTTADRTIAYRVYDIRTVKPNDLKNLRIEQGKDIATLVTCTPIFLNTHRLLVTGRRVAMPDDAPYPQDAPRTNANDKRPFIIAVITLLALTPLAVFVSGRRTRRPYGFHGRPTAKHI